MIKTKQDDMELCAVVTLSFEFINPRINIENIFEILFGRKPVTMDTQTMTTRRYKLPLLKCASSLKIIISCFNKLFIIIYKCR